MATLEEQFNAAAERIKTEKPSDGKDKSTEDKLKVYSLYKQATVGDVTGSQPWAVKIEARAKWDAWAAHKGKSKDDAMTEYIAEVEAQLA